MILICKKKDYGKALNVKVLSLHHGEMGMKDYRLP